MTFLERAMEDGLSELEAIDLHCPDDLGYEPVRDLQESMEFCNRSCRSCWEREMPEQNETVRPKRVCTESCAWAVPSTSQDRTVCGYVKCAWDHTPKRCGQECDVDVDRIKQHNHIPPERHQQTECATIDSSAHATNTERNQSDPVNHPSHYNKGGVECIDCIESAVSGLSGPDAVLTGNVIKYMYRWKDKNGLEDLQKAEFYLKRLIDKVGKNQSV